MCASREAVRGSQAPRRARQPVWWVTVRVCVLEPIPLAWPKALVSVQRVRALLVEQAGILDLCTRVAGLDSSAL